MLSLYFITALYFYNYFHSTASFTVLNYSLIALGQHSNGVHSNAVVFSSVLSLNPLARSAVTIFRFFDRLYFHRHEYVPRIAYQNIKKIQTSIVYLLSGWIHGIYSHSKNKQQKLNKTKPKLKLKRN